MTGSSGLGIGLMEATGTIFSAVKGGGLLGTAMEGTTVTGGVTTGGLASELTAVATECLAVARVTDVGATRVELAVTAVTAEVEADTMVVVTPAMPARAKFGCWTMMCTSEASCCSETLVEGCPARIGWPNSSSFGVVTGLGKGLSSAIKGMGLDTTRFSAGTGTGSFLMTMEVGWVGVVGAGSVGGTSILCTCSCLTASFDPLPMVSSIPLGSWFSPLVPAAGFPPSMALIAASCTS